MTMSAILMAPVVSVSSASVGDQVGQRDRRCFVDIGDGQRVQCGIIRRAGNGRVVDLDGDVEAGLSSRSRGRCRPSSCSSVPTISKAAASAPAKVRSLVPKRIVGDDDVGHLDGGRGVGILGQDC